MSRSICLMTALLCMAGSFKNSAHAHSSTPFVRMARELASAAAHAHRSSEQSQGEFGGRPIMIMLTSAIWMFKIQVDQLVNVADIREF